MSVKTVDWQEAQTRFADLLAFALAGNDIIIARDNKPVLRLQPTNQESKPKRVAGLHRGAAKIAEDFDEPLPDESWLGKSI